MEEFEKEIHDLMRWLETTRARMTMRDTTRDLKDQLAVQEVRHSLIYILYLFFSVLTDILLLLLKVNYNTFLSMCPSGMCQCVLMIYMHLFLQKIE